MQRDIYTVDVYMRERALPLRLTRHACVRTCVRACARAAREYFHTEVNNTPRYPGQGWPTTTTLPVRRRYRLSRRRCSRNASPRESVVSSTRDVYVLAARTYACRRNKPPANYRVVAIVSAVNTPRRDPWYRAR